MKDRNRQDDEAHERLVMAISLGRLVADIRHCPQTLQLGQPQYRSSSPSQCSL
jgi:hypothetical protein